MDSSDDSSFAWTDASTHPDSGDSTSIEETMNDKHNESEWEKGYKKKLPKNSFRTESEVKHELLNGHSVKCEPESDVPSSTSPQKKKRKREHTPGSDSEQATDYLDGMVKKEHHPKGLDSPDLKPKKSKVKHAEEYYDNKESSQELMNSSDQVTKKKKSKRKKERQDSSDMIIEDKFSAEETVVETRPERNSESSMTLHLQEDKESSQELMDSSDQVTKKKKLKRKKERQDSSDMIIEDKFSAEETVVETRPERNSESSMTLHLQEDESSTKNKKKDKKKKKRNQDSNSLNNDSVQHDTERCYEVSEVVTQEDTTHYEREILIGREENKFSDRIQFEDGEDLLAACNEIADNNNQSSKLKRFLKANPHLQSFPSTSGGDSIVSQDDEIWLFHCPYEVNILSLKDSDISLDNKCKIKTDSQTFVGNVENEMSRAAVMTFQHGRPIIKNFKLNGVVNLHKRIPKAHFIQDNVMANNQTDFIPLPETKCRHPLFGPDYKKAIKLPSSIRARLHSTQFEPLSTTVIEGKKKKKKKYEQVDNSEDVVDGVIASNNEGSENMGGGKRKHRHSYADSDQPVRKKSKKVKHEKESAETWDSEKAIEDNLFNF